MQGLPHRAGFTETFEMSFTKTSWILACVLAASSVFAAEAPGARLTAAQAALEDGLYELAEKQAGVVLSATDVISPVERGDAAIVLSRALYGQGRFKEMLDGLDGLPADTQTTEPGAVVYWHAVAQYESRAMKKALSEIRGFATRFPGSSLGPRVSRLEAWCELKEGRRDAALAIFAQFDRQYGTTPEGAANLLEWGQALLASGNAAAARGVLERLVTRDAASGTVQDGKLWLAKAMTADGKADAAWNLLNLVAEDVAVRVDRRALAWMSLSEINAGRSNLEAAVTSAARGVELAPTPALKNRGKAMMGRWMLRQGKLAAGAALLRPVIAQMTDDPIAAELQLELAGGYLDGKEPEKAAAEYQNYLETFLAPTGRMQAYRGRAMALWDLKRYAESATMYEKASWLVSDPAVREALAIKSADALFANEQYKLSAAAYGKVLADFPATALTPEVLFQSAESLARQSLWDDAERGFREVVRRYPARAEAERSLMRMAELKEERGPAFIREALAGYNEVMNMYPAGALYAEALHRHGLAAYRLGDIDMALKDFSRVMQEFPSSRAAPHAYFMRGWSLYMRGEEAESLKVCREFTTKYPDTEWTPGVMFWIGEYAFNHTSYAEAETRFAEVALKFPKDPQAESALIWAGRAAMMQKEYLRAVEYFSRLARAYPAGERLAEARFLQGDALSELGEFSRAILVFDELIAKFPNSTLVGAAWGRRGDCQFTLGATDPKRYEEAISSYRSVARSPGTGFDLELQAEYKIGRCYDKMGRRTDAFEQYYTRVVCRYLAAVTPDSASSMWFTKAAFSAADILEADKNWKRAIRVLERVVGAKVPAGGDAGKRIEQIRNEHWVW